jgi:putative hemolysin
MMELILLLIFILFSAFFSLSETAITTVSRLRIAHLVEGKKPGAKNLRRLREDPAKLLATILVGNNIVNISASILGATVATSYFHKLGMKEEGLILGIATGLMTLLILVFGEITPKTLAIHNAESLALLVSPVMTVFEAILYPVAWLMTTISRPFVFLFRGKIPEQGPFVTEEEIKALLFVGEREGVIEREEREMISSVFKFGDLTVKEVMTPLQKMVCVDNGDSVGNAITRIKESGHSRLPIFDKSMDNIVGVIFAKDLLDAGKGEKVGEYIRPVIFIPGNKKVSDLMDQMQSEYKHMAIVIDEYGRTIGLVSLEDLLEEIVGEIHDEYERKIK